MLENWWFHKFRADKVQKEKQENHTISWENYFKRMFKELKGGVNNGKGKNNTEDNN